MSSMLINPHHKDDFDGQDPYTLAEGYIDLLMPFFPEYENFHIDKVIAIYQPDYKKNSRMRKAYRHIDELMTRVYGYAEREGPGVIPIRLTHKGREAKKAGGHEAYLKKLEEDQNRKTNSVSVGNNYAPIIQDSRFRSRSIKSMVTIEPTAPPTPDPKSMASKLSGFIFKHIAKIAIGIMVALFTGYLIYYFGWN